MCSTHRAFFCLSIFFCLAMFEVAHPAFAGKEPKKRVAVIEFENRAGRTYENREAYRSMGTGLAEMLISKLIETDRFIVLERIHLDDVLGEQELIERGMLNPDVVSRLTSAQVLVRGTITQIEVTNSGGGGLNLRRLGVRLGRQKVKIRIALSLQLLDITTGQILHSEIVDGEATKKSIAAKVSFEGIGLNTESAKSTPMGEAVEELMGKAVTSVVEGMKKVPWQGSVVKVSGRQIFVNAGRAENVEPGLQLVVYEKGQELVDPETNESLGRLDEEIGMIEIEQIGDQFSIGHVVEGEGFARGNLVKPVPALEGDLGISEEISDAARR